MLFDRVFVVMITTAIIVATSMLGCRSQSEPEIAAGIDGCSTCAMVIDDINQAGGYFLDREFQPFCSVGCLLDSYEQRRKRWQPLPDRIYVADFVRGDMHVVDAATFLLTDHFPTVMDWGIVAFADSSVAKEHRHHEDEILTDWLGVRTLRGDPDRTLSSSFSDQGMDPETVEMNKGELAVWDVRAEALSGDLVFRIRGYESLGEIEVPAVGEARSIRILATNPGDGFPLERVSDGKTLGRLRVTGPHTEDEGER